MRTFAIYYEPSAYSFKSKLMGRQSAGQSFIQAVADRRLEKLWCFSETRNQAQELAETLTRLGSTRTGIRWIPFDQQTQIEEAGVLYRPDPAIASHAWQRLAYAAPRSYSLCGITHTISSHGPMEAFSGYLTAPLEHWDAVICTSRCARDAIRHIVEKQAEHLAARIGASRFSLPQLPIIPLGVHVRHFVRTPEARQAARKNLGLASDEVAVLFAGRLIVHGKAHPVPMYIALEEAAQGRKVALIQAGQAPNAEILKMFTEEPKRFCPSVRLIMIDGSNNENYRAAWSAADIFTSLSDNIQETFGLTPIEAMAAGLPVVVSDWNGYKDTVRDGIDGFRIPTLTLRPGSREELANRYDLGLISFDHYSAYTSQLVAVDIEAATEAYRKLIDSSELRARMGEAGQRRAQEFYDWAVVFRQYEALWEELAERRRSDPQLAPPLPRQRRPDRANPFSMFATYPTYQAGPTVVFCRRFDVNLDDAISRTNLPSTSFAQPVLPSQAVIEAIYGAIDLNWFSIAELVHKLPDVQEGTLSSALVWLTKIGALRFKSA